MQSYRRRDPRCNLLREQGREMTARTCWQQPSSRVRPTGICGIIWAKVAARWWTTLALLRRLRVPQI
jgi:hypothetical protein